MNKTLIILILASIGIQAQTQKTLYPDGKIKSEIFKEKGEVKSVTKYYPSGVIKTVVAIETDSTSKVVFYQKSGEPFSQGAYLNKQKQGVWKFYTDSRLWMTRSYKNGILDGQVKEYFRNGTLSLISNFKSGKKEGFQKTFNRAGQLTQQMKFKEGKIVGHYKEYNPKNGVPVLQGFYRNGVKDGYWYYFDNNGKQKLSLEYKNGICLNQKELDKLNSDILTSEINNKEKYKHMEDENEFINSMFYGYSQK